MIKKSIFYAAAAVAMVAAALQPVHAQDKTEITLARFFGACEADFGKSVDVRAARGECGVITTLVNKFNATNKDNIVVKPQIAEWGPYYDQLTSRIVARDVPTIAVMHQSSIGPLPGPVSNARSESSAPTHVTLATPPTLTTASGRGRSRTRAA